MTAGKINRIYILGLGAMGAMYASKLQEMNAGTVKIITGPERRKRYEAEGVTVNGISFPFGFIGTDNENLPADLIIMAVKAIHLDQAIHDIRPFVGKDTVIISLLNGIVSEEQIGAQLGHAHVLPAFGIGMDALREGTAVSYTNMGKIVFGERDNVLSARVAAIRDLFDRARIPYSVPENILHAMWFKFMLNVAVNQVSAILKAPYGMLRENADARELMVLAAREVVLLSQKTGIDLKEENIEEFLAIIDKLDPDGKTSMLQDMEAGRKTEVDIFAGTVMALGRQLGVETPVNDLFFRIIRALEMQKITPSVLKPTGQMPK